LKTKHVWQHSSCEGSSDGSICVSTLSWCWCPGYALHWVCCAVLWQQRRSVISAFGDT
jgi:hypothetical protein